MTRFIAPRFIGIMFLGIAALCLATVIGHFNDLSMVVRSYDSTVVGYILSLLLAAFALSIEEKDHSEK